MVDSKGMAKEVLNSSAPSPQARPLASPAASGSLPSKAGTPRLGVKAPRYCISHSSGSERAYLARQNQLPSPPNSAPSSAQGGADENFLRRGRQVDEMINALHSDKAEDYNKRLSQAFQELSGGQLNLADEAAKDTTRVRCMDHLGPAAKGGVPGLVSMDPPRSARSSQCSRQSRKKTAPKVIPPWGPERANIDRPPAILALQKQQQYCRMLDLQNADKEAQARVDLEEDIRMQQTTSTSLETAYHTWGTETCDARKERAIFKEHLATINHKREALLAKKEAERQDGERLIAQTEKKMAWQWHLKRAQEAKEKEQMAKEWMDASNEKKRLQQAKRAASLQEEQEAIKHIEDGMIPDKFNRRPYEQCASYQNVVNLKHIRPGSQVKRRGSAR